MWSMPRYHKSTWTKLQSLCEAFPKAKNCWASPQEVQVPGCWWAESCASFQYCFCSIGNKNYGLCDWMNKQQTVFLLHQWAISSCYSNLVCAWRYLRHRKTDMIGNYPSEYKTSLTTNFCNFFSEANSSVL